MKEPQQITKPPNDAALLLHPEAIRLHYECQLLREEFAKLVVERDSLLRERLPSIEAEYQLQLGHLEYESFTLEVETRELKRRIELLQAARNRREKASLKEIDKQIEKEFSTWRAKVEEMADAVDAAKAFADLPTLSAEESKELQTLYRKLAKKLHPDIAPEQTERVKNLWLQASEAYERADLEELRALWLLVQGENDFCETESAKDESSTLELLRRRKEALSENIHRMLDHLAQIKSTPPYTLREILEDKEYVAERAAQLRRKIEWQREYKRQLEKLWRTLKRDFAASDERYKSEDSFAAKSEDWPDIIGD